MSIVECKYCERKHEKFRDKSLAYQKKFNMCGRGRENTFALVCKQKSGEFKWKKKETVNHVKETEDLQNSSDDEYCFIVLLKHSKEECINAVHEQPCKAKILATI